MYELSYDGEKKYNQISERKLPMLCQVGSLMCKCVSFYLPRQCLLGCLFHRWMSNGPHRLQSPKSCTTRLKINFIQPYTVFRGRFYILEAPKSLEWFSSILNLGIKVCFEAQKSQIRPKLLISSSLWNLSILICTFRDGSLSKFLQSWHWKSKTSTPRWSPYGHYVEAWAICQ